MSGEGGEEEIAAERVATCENRPIGTDQHGVRKTKDAIPVAECTVGIKHLRPGYPVSIDKRANLRLDVAYGYADNLQLL
jgi:hypothetical protein